LKFLDATCQKKNSVTLINEMALTFALLGGAGEKKSRTGEPTRISVASGKNWSELRGKKGTAKEVRMSWRRGKTTSEIRENRWLRGKKKTFPRQAILPKTSCGSLVGSGKSSAQRNFIYSQLQLGDNVKNKTLLLQPRLDMGKMKPMRKPGLKKATGGFLAPTTSLAL